MTSISDVWGWLTRSGRKRARANYAAVTAVALAAVAIEVAVVEALASPVAAARQPVPSAARSLSLGAAGGSALHIERPQAPTERPQAASAPRLSSIFSGVPVTVLRAYRRAADVLSQADPGCGLRVALLAAIGRVESNHAAGGTVDDNGTTLEPILGPPLNGNGFAAVADTDRGAYDDDTTWDRAVGPMQFIPSTWDRWGVDGNRDGIADPHNVYDAALAAGWYLCAGERNLRDIVDLREAIFSYNHSDEYVRVVLAWMAVYQGRTTALPDASASAGSAQTQSSSPGRARQAGPRRDHSESSEKDRPTSPSPSPEAAPAPPIPESPTLPLVPAPGPPGIPVGS